MKRSSGKNARSQEFEIVDFMTEFARFLVMAGVSRRRFARMVEYAYFRAASEQARFHNARLNQSAVAAMTGLTRSQVRLMLKQEHRTLDARNDCIDRIINTWTSDAEYITVNFTPRQLRLTGPRPSFSSLVKKVGGDIPSRSILRELRRQRLVDISGNKISLNPTTTTGETRALRHLSAALARLIASSGDAKYRPSPLRTVSLEVSYAAQSAAGRILMQRRLSKILKSAVAEIEAAGSAIAMESPSMLSGSSGKVSNARLLVLTHEQDRRVSRKSRRERS